SLMQYCQSSQPWPDKDQELCQHSADGDDQSLISDQVSSEKSGILNEEVDPGTNTRRKQHDLPDPALPEGINDLCTFREFSQAILQDRDILIDIFIFFQLQKIIC